MSLAEAELTITQIDQQIAFHESRILELKALRPNGLKTFYRFNLARPSTSVVVYASDQQQAHARVTARLDREYGPTGYVIHPVVKTFVDAEEAALNSATGSNLLHCLTPEEATEFLADWNTEHRHDPKPAKSARLNQIQRDIANYEHQQRLKEAMR